MDRLEIGAVGAIALMVLLVLRTHAGRAGLGKVFSRVGGFARSVIVGVV